jgi:hypothetical protein
MLRAKQIIDLVQDKNKEVYISDPVTTITIQHSLGKIPSITVIDTTGRSIECDIDYSINPTEQITLNFSYAFSGKVLFN